MSYFLKDWSNESTVANVGRLLARIFTKMAQAVEQQPDEFDTALEEIEQLTNANKWQEAANRLQQCAIEYPEHTSALCEWLGRVYFWELNDNANALKAFNKALENANSENTEWIAKLKRGIYYVYSNEYLEKGDNSLLPRMRKLAFYMSQYGNDTENIGTDDKPLTEKEDGYAGLEITDELYSDQFLAMPYRERKVLMPVKQYTDLEQEVVKVISIDNLPKDIVFPFGHPIANQLYIGHPLLAHKYIPFENYQLELVEDKVREFCSIAQSLGATEISIECLNSSASDSSYNGTKNASGKVNYKVADVSGSYNEDSSSRLIEDLDRSISLHQTFSPKTAPVLPENLVWYNNEPSWQRLYTQRMNGSLLTHQERIESRKSQMVESNEMKQIKGEVETLFFHGRCKMSKKEKKKYQIHIHENAVLAINITFAPIDQLTGSSSSTAALQQPASPANNTLSLSAEEQKYITEVKECLADGEIGSVERRLLNKLLMKLGISKERAAELEASLLQPQSTLTEDEQEYLEAFQEAMKEEDGVISEKKRRTLDKIMRINIISEARAKEIEQMYSAQ